MAYSDSFPATRPVFQADFANGGRVDPRITFSRSDTPPTYAAPSAVHYWSNEKHLSSENLLSYSNDLSTWTSSTTTTPTTNNTAPDGTSTATEVAENTASSSHNRYSSFPAISGTNYTYLVFAKANGRTQFRIVPQATTTIASVKFDLSAVTATVISGSTVGVPTITAVGSTGWYRCELTVTATGSGNGYHQLDILDAAGNGTYTGDGSSGLYFWGAQVSSSGETVLNETSGQIHREYAPTLKSVSTAGQPRFEYSPTDSASMGLLIEGSSTNLYPYGSDQYNWSGARRLVQSNAAISPAGTLTADLVTLNDADADTHYVFQYVSVTSGTTYTISQYVKAAGLNYVFLRPNTGFASNIVTFDLSNGTIVANAGGLGASIEPVGNEWYRISVTATANATVSNATCALYFSESSSTTVTATGDSYRGVLLWGAQWEASSFASSLVDTGTSSSTVTRAADSASMVDSSLFDNGSGAVFVESSSIDKSAAYSGIVSLNDGSGSNKVELLNYFSYIRGNVTASGSQQSDHYGSSFGSNVPFKTCITYDTNSVSLYANGSEIGATDTSAALPSVDRITLGNLSGGGDYLNGHLKRVAVYSDSISETAAAAITS